MRRLLLVLLAALPVLADVTLSPPAPDDETPVTLVLRTMWPDGCLPRDPVWTRTAGKVEILYTVPTTGGGCRTAFTPWNEDVALGALEAGEWEIVVKVKELDTSTVAQLRVAVADASPTFRIDPPILRGGEPRNTARLVMLQETSVLCNPVPANISVRVDGALVPSVRIGCILLVDLPALPPGGADVELRAGGKIFSVRSAIRVVDPNVPDPNVFQRVLIPVLYEGPGGFGSQWTTEAFMTNRGPETSNQGHELEPVLEVSKPLPPLPMGTQSPSLISLFGNHASGLLLFVPHGQDVRFGNLIRDTSRDASQFGTEVPVVREEDTGAFIELTNIPFDPRFRVQLRIYGLEGVGFAVTVTDDKGDGKTVTLNGPCTEVPCNSNQPAYASVDLRDLYPSLKEGRLRIGINSQVSNRKLWAFVTVTNNDTQDVTVISPQ